MLFRSSKLINNSNESIEGFMFCFSVLAPVKIIDNCALHFSSGGYAELKPNAGFVLKPGDEWSFKFAYEESRHKPMNYRWSPQGCFLKTENEEIFNLNVIDLDLERISSVAPIPHISGDKLNYESLRLVPHPYSWNASAGVCNLCPPVNVFFDDNSIIHSAYESACQLGKRLNLNLFPEKINNEISNASTSLKIKYLDSMDESSYEIIKIGRASCRERV